ncbi:hypothetical protein BFU36_03265 [Sulfolobus sp. A20]|uniref:hypothetical protein n=1 Tax=Sulfolobaceae TaxID=118883 RepID=UPI0008460C37|nr:MULTISPECIES: hypothetical protein [unclassified Sulfolobus]TRM74650.1 hypothetical protein DJ523_04395 [Sulfolobus sp. E5]TRM78118.1 hypothetical protein DJ528_05450 [Sulfolobus sp. B5]TRM78571.1 hypothetical protein DJ532_00875 [Sulfolobus sp. A20-N-F8]TRM83167.1 hypothetical protein DJ531_06645 [Sulfolobus sp. A20-N-F6]TRM85272.1 hypothetical protein DJ522_01440 [Sulfolobus sp. F3]TRM87570.1 hypothetical protein DJ529_08000 [Sulfolobus sp. C3]TRM99370.1 hypothetical protein DJ530_09020
MPTISEQKQVIKVNSKVFLYGKHKGKEYYGVSIPWRIAKQLIGKTLDATLLLPDGELRVHGVEVIYVSGKLAITVPAKYSDRLKGVERVDVLLEEIE